MFVMKNKDTKTLVLIDSHALIHRAYHALPPLNTGKGELVNAVFGFTSILLKVLKELQPDYIAAAFDMAAPTFRHKEFDDYKATRAKAPDELYAQIKRVKDVLAAFNIPVFEKEGFEADDILGTIAHQVKTKNQKLKTVIVTGDLDTLQLVNDKVNIYTLKKGIKDTIIYDEAAVKERFEGLAPSQMNDYKGLKGDPSDNIPGVPGVGEKTAIELLKEYGSLEKLYKELEKLHPAGGHPKGEKTNPSTSLDKARDKTLGVKSNNLFKKLLDFKDQAFFSKYLATIKQDVPIKFDLSAALAKDFDKQKVVELFKELGFFSLVNRLSAADEKNLLPKESAKSAGDKKTEKIIPGQGSLLNDEPTVLEKIEQAREQGVLSAQIYQIEKELAPVLVKMQQAGIKIDKDYLKKLGDSLGQKIKMLEAKIYKLAGVEFNINSPQQLSEVLFTKLNLQIKGLKKTPGKVISTAASELTKLRGEHEVVDCVIEYRELAKLKNTYIDALPELVASDGRLHTTFDQLGTTTGRLSSKNPNLQNIPIKTELGREIRKAFVAERGYKLLSADYSQIELRVVASLSGDREMIKAFSEGKDIHTATAAEVLGIGASEVSPEARRMAKVLNFGVIYGMGSHGFAQAAGIEYGKAKDFIKKYFEEFSGVARYLENSRQSAAKNGFVQTLFGRKRFVPEINSSAWNLRQAAERAAVNMPVQGTAADLLKMAMVEIAKSEWLVANSKMLLQVHDELVFEVAEDKVARAAQEIKKIMENIYKLAVPLKVDLEAGDNWGELKKLLIQS